LLTVSVVRRACSSATLVECVENLVNWAEIPLEKALQTVTSTPARMLGLQDCKGSLEVGADADLVVLSEGVGPDGRVTLSVDEVYKFGVKVHDSAQMEEGAVKARL
jgi:N-acetylglucosamine-6-phosphate deacetylase